MQDPVPFLNLEYFLGFVLDITRGIGRFFAPLFDPGAPRAGFDVRFFTEIFLPLLAVFAIVLLVYYWLQTLSLMKREREAIAESLLDEQAAPTTDNPRWSRVVGLFASANQSDWRLAIIEADAMLEDLTRELGYEGETLGERLKSINADNFPPIQAAWDAHTVRNKIAHEGLEYQLTEREARRVHAQFEYVFSTMQYI